MPKNFCYPRVFKRRLLTKLLLVMTTSEASSHRTNGKKLLLAMNLTAILLLAFGLAATAAGHGQNISLKLEDAPLEKLFTEVQKQSTYSFVYFKNDLRKAKTIDLNIENGTITEILEAVFKDQPLTYTIVENSIIIKKKAVGQVSTPLVSPVLDAPPVTGIVRGPDGQPLAGVNIMVKGTKKGTTSAADGGFNIEADNGDVLIFSSIGYNEREITVASNKPIGVISLSASENKLDEVQIIAYGQTSKRLSTGNIASIKAKDIQEQPVNNPLLALQGRVPGLTVTQQSGFAGTGVVVRLQGQNSIFRGNDPFYVIDGIPFSSQLLPNLANVLRTSGTRSNGNPLNFISPSEIESMEILKDADATAIYGSRAANGAILITTKKAKSGQVRVDLNFQNGFGKVPRKLDLLNTQEFLALRKEAYANDGIAVPAIGDAPDASNYDLTFWGQNDYTDWQKELIGKTAKYLDAQLGLSGGNENVQYLFSSNFHKETTVLPSDLSDRKTSFKFNLNSTSNNKKLKFSFSSSYLIDNNKLPTIDLTNTAMTLSPNYPALKLSDGSLNWAPTNNGVSSISNPLATLNAVYFNRTTNLISNAIVNYTFLPGLKFQSSFGYNALVSNEISISPSSSTAPEFVSTFDRMANYGNNESRSWIVEPQLSYTKSMRWGTLETLIGSSIQQTASVRKLVEGHGYNSDFVLENINAAASIIAPPNTAIDALYKYNAIFGRINYNLNNTYLLNLTARRDGTSRFGAENRFHNFGAVGAAWIFSNVKFFKENISFISFGKLKASYGTTGSDQIEDYAYLSLYQSVNPGVPYGGGGGLLPTRLTNPFIHWENVRKLSIGTDGGVLADRIIFSINYFKNRSSNQLLTYGIAPSTGFSGISSNFPAVVQNSGWEISITTENVRTKEFTWSTDFNITFPKNKLIKFDGLESSAYAGQYKIGLPITIERFIKYAGVNPASGLYEFLDKDGKLSSNPGFDETNFTVYKNNEQTLYGGFGSSFSFHGFSLNVLFQFVKQQARNYYYGSTVPGSYDPRNEPTTVLDHWKSEGDQKNVQKLTTSDFGVIFPTFYLQLSDASWTDASYARLKNLSLSWQLPKAWQQTVRMKNARIYVLGQNLLTITNYQGLDPESKSSVSLPPLRVITMGIQCSF